MLRIRKTITYNADYHELVTQIKSNAESGFNESELYFLTIIFKLLPEVINPDWTLGNHLKIPKRKRYKKYGQEIG